MVLLADASFMLHLARVGLRLPRCFAGERIGNTVVTFAADKTLAAGDQGTVQVFTASAAFTGTLPSAAIVLADWLIIIKNDGAADLLVATNGAETISGAASLTLKAGQGTLLVSDGTNWREPIPAVSSDSLSPTAMVSAFSLTSAPSGWVALNKSTISDAGAGADDAGTDNEALFLSLHGTFTDEQVPVVEVITAWKAVESIDTTTNRLTITAHGYLATEKVILTDDGGSVAPTPLEFNN